MVKSKEILNKENYFETVCCDNDEMTSTRTHWTPREFLDLYLETQTVSASISQLASPSR